MAKSAYSTFARRTTPQTEPLNSRQTKNNAGGFVYATNLWATMERFLILGSEGGSYYVGEQKLTTLGAHNVIKAIETDGKRAVDMIVGVSDSGRAVKNDPALFALALAAASEDRATRQYALANLNKVARIPTHLFHFINYVQGLRGWGRSLRTAVANWYVGKGADAIAYHAVKYQSRDGWSNKDVIVLAHPPRTSDAHSAVFNWIMKGKEGITEHTPRVILGFQAAHAATTAKRVAELVREHNLTREMLPTPMLKERIVWEALLERMPMTALIRNLNVLTDLKIIDTFSDAANKVSAQLRNLDALKKARVHPLTILNALKTYAAGYGMRGTKTWTPVQQVVDALDDAFYLAFDTVEPTNKNVLIALDVSASMSAAISGSPFITCCEAATALALVTAHVEPNHAIFRFNTGMQALPFKKGMRLDAAMKYTDAINGGGTDCALPMVVAAQNKWAVDAFQVLTDSETWAGPIHPMKALENYRKVSNKPTAKLIVAAMVASPFTIADPKDPHCLDVVGFDTNAPAVLSEFIRN